MLLLNHSNIIMLAFFSPLGGLKVVTSAHKSVLKIKLKSRNGV